MKPLYLQRNGVLVRRRSEVQFLSAAPFFPPICNMEKQFPHDRGNQENAHA